MTGAGKIAELEAAVEASIRPGMSVHLTTQSRAATRAIQRVFHGQKLDLTLVMCRVGGGNAADLVASGLVRRVIAGSYGAVSSQYTGRYPQVGRAYASGEVEFEHWSFLSLTQRLMAGAQGYPFALTHSLRNSTMAATNERDYRLIESPVDPDREIGVMSALRPDISFVHVAAADAAGNALMVPPLEDGAWGALASKDGAVVTTEHLVSNDVIRNHSHLVRLPGRHVRHVCEVPYGAHPGPFGSSVLGELRHYDEDADFYGQYFAAVRSKDPAELAAFVDEWILQPSAASYVAKLGPDRLAGLEHRSVQRSAPAPSRAAESPDPVVEMGVPPSEVPPSPTETLMTLASRAVAAQIEHAGRRILLVGVGLSEVPAVVAYERLKPEFPDLALAMGHGYFGFEPAPGRSEPDAAGSLMTTDTVGIYGTLLAGEDRPGLAILGAAQVDRFGNMNSTLIAGKLLTGSGGSNDASSVCETIVVTRLSRERLVDDVEYVTCAGANVSTVITERGVFEKSGGETLVLTSYVLHDGETESDALAEIEANCGWKVEVAPDAGAAAPSTPEELRLIRRYMPSRYQTGPSSSQPKGTQPS